MATISAIWKIKGDCVCVYIYIYIYIFVYFVYLCVSQSFKEVNLADIKNCLTLVVKIESLESIKSRQNKC